MTNPVFGARTTLLFALLCIFLLSCRHRQSGDDGENHAPEKAVVTVKTASIVEEDAMLTVNAYGRTDALKKEKLLAPMAGRIASLKAYEGTAARRGDVLAIIETKESESAKRGAELMLRMATTPEQKAEAEHILHLARTTQNNVTITAKFDGYVSTRNVSEGELVAENAELMTIVDLSTVDFLADVPLRDLPPVKVGQHASIRFPSFQGEIFPAIVDAVNPQADIQSQTVKVRLRFLHRPGGLRATLRTDMNGNASIVAGVRPRAFFVPKAALIRNDEDNTYSVVTVTPDSLTLRIPVDVGIRTDSTVEIMSSGIHHGMKVITEGHYSLSDSTRVTISQ